MDKHTLLTDWVNIVSQNNIDQHSVEWYNERIDTIGGSSIGTIIGVDKYCSLRQFIRDRINNRQYTKLCMNWGTLFEDTLREHTERTLNCKIIADNIFIKHNKYITYSPDGLGVLSKPLFDDEKIVLFEFKCPYSRKFSRAIDDKYVAQVQMGLDLISVSDIGILVQGWFKRAAINDCQGIIGFYASIPLDNFVHDIIRGISMPINFGEVSDNLLNSLIESTIGPHKLVTTVSITNMPLDELLSRQKCDTILIGYLPWILQNYTYDTIEKNGGFIQRSMPLIESVVDFIVECKKNVDHANIEAHLERFIEGIYDSSS